LGVRLGVSRASRSAAARRSSIKSCGCEFGHYALSAWRASQAVARSRILALAFDRFTPLAGTPLLMRTRGFLSCFSARVTTLSDAWDASCSTARPAQALTINETAPVIGSIGH
jgi:hypothetical protein